MRLAKVNIRKRFLSHKTLTSKSPHKSQKNGVPEVVGAFWFLEEELSLDKAREMARRLEINGSEGVTFYGSAERIYKAKRRKQNARVTSLPRNKYEPKTESANTGRSYGFPLENDDDEASSNEDLSEILDYPHKPVAKSSSKPQNKNEASPLMSPPTSQDTQHDSSENTTPTKHSFNKEEETPPMPGSFVFEEPPSSPAFSSAQTDNFTINQALYSTPRRPFYTNPGIAIEHRYNSRSPLPPPGQVTDMTPRQLAVFARRKQEFERYMVRSTTPSLLNESISGDDYKPYSEKEQAERRRRKRDLEKWREEKEALKRDAEKTQGSKASNKDGRGRERDDQGMVDVDMETRPAKRSKSSNLFNSLLAENEDEFNISTAGSGIGFGSNKEGSLIQSPSSSTSSAGSDTERETSVSQKVKDALEDVEEADKIITDEATGGAAKSFEVPTPSPSPSPTLQPVQSFTKSMSSHIPKVPSRLRNTVAPSSPSGSPQKTEMPLVTKNSMVDIDVITKAVMALPPSKLIDYKFPPLGQQPRDFINSKVIDEVLSKYK